MGSEPAVLRWRPSGSCRLHSLIWAGLALAKTTGDDTSSGKDSFSLSHSSPTRLELATELPPALPEALEASHSR